MATSMSLEPRFLRNYLVAEIKEEEGNKNLYVIFMEILKKEKYSEEVLKKYGKKLREDVQMMFDEAPEETHRELAKDILIAECEVLESTHFLTNAILIHICTKYLFKYILE